MQSLVANAYHAKGTPISVLLLKMAIRDFAVSRERESYGKIRFANANDGTLRLFKNSSCGCAAYSSIKRLPRKRHTDRCAFCVVGDKRLELPTSSM